MGISPIFSLLCKPVASAILLLSTTKAAVHNCCGHGGLIEGQSSGRDLFLRLLFALKQVQQLGQKAVPSSMYVPSRATRNVFKAFRNRIERRTQRNFEGFSVQCPVRGHGVDQVTFIGWVSGIVPRICGICLFENFLKLISFTS